MLWVHEVPSSNPGAPTNDFIYLAVRMGMTCCSVIPEMVLIAWLGLPVVPELSV